MKKSIQLSKLAGIASPQAGRHISQRVGALGKTPGVASKSTGTNQQHQNIPTLPQGRGRFWEYGQPAGPVPAGS
jgi:hypothetical protein